MKIRNWIRYATTEKNTRPYRAVAGLELVRGLFKFNLITFIYSSEACKDLEDISSRVAPSSLPAFCPTMSAVTEEKC